MNATAIVAPVRRSAPGSRLVAGTPSRRPPCSIQPIPTAASTNTGATVSSPNCASNSRPATPVGT